MPRTTPIVVGRPALYNLSSSRNGGPMVKKWKVAPRYDPGRIPPASRGYLRTGGMFNSPERKYLDSNISVNDIPLGGAYVPSLNIIPQNASSTGRDGRKVQIKSIHVRGAFSSNAQNINGGRYRIIIFLDKQCNGTGLTNVTELLQTTSVDSYNNLSNSSRFVVYSDKTYISNPSAGIQFNPATGATTLVSQKLIRVNFNKRLNLPIEFDSSVATGAVSSIRSNNLQIVYLSDVQGGIALNDFVGSCRIRFTDF